MLVFYCFFYYSICLLLENEDLLLAAYCPHFGVSPSESNSEGFFFELPSCGATQRSQKKKFLLKRQEGWILHPQEQKIDQNSVQLQ